MQEPVKGPIDKMLDGLLESLGCNCGNAENEPEPEPEAEPAKTEPPDEVEVKKYGCFSCCFGTSTVMLSKQQLEEMAREISALEDEIEAEEKPDEKAEGDKEGKPAEDEKGKEKQDESAKDAREEEKQDEPAKGKKKSIESKQVSLLHHAYKYD